MRTAPKRTFKVLEQWKRKTALFAKLSYFKFKRLYIITYPKIKFNNYKTDLQSEPIAVIGISGRFPGCSNVTEYWQHLESNDDLITEIPRERWDWRKYYGDCYFEHNKTKAKWGGFIKEFDCFDPLFFQISPSEAELMDPQGRLLIETIWATIEDAGYPVSALSGTKTGVFTGVSTGDYRDLWQRTTTLHDQSVFSMIYHFTVPNRISYLLNLHGPSEPIDTACSSSLVAVHRAIESIRQGSCDTALVGGVSVIADPNMVVNLDLSGALCEDRRCKTFDKSANGYVRGEGVGALFLKPLSKAIEDRDQIYGLIIGSAENHGGKAISPTSPNPVAQKQLIATTYSNAKIDPRTITYIEAHGTGTELGDPIEVNGLKMAFDELYKRQGITALKEPHCGLGSVKTNIGHLEAASGVAGLIKVLLMMKHKKIPGNVHLKETNPYLKLENSPFYLVKETQDWQGVLDTDGKTVPRRAGVSSFGVTGANAHVVLEQWVETLEYKSLQTQNSGIKPCYLITLSARREDRLKRKVTELLQWLDNENQEKDLEAISYTLNGGRSHFSKRCCIVASSVEELKQTLEMVKKGNDVDNYLSGDDSKIKVDEKVIYNKVLEGLVKELQNIDYSNTQQYRNNLLALGGLYIKGYAIDWRLLHQGEVCRRISMPTYPFERKRYWMDVKQALKGGGFESQKSHHKQLLHPLVHENLSTLKDQKFSSLFNGKEFFLEDHIVKGSKVL